MGAGPAPQAVPRAQVTRAHGIATEGRLWRSHPYSRLWGGSLASPTDHPRQGEPGAAWPGEDTADRSPPGKCHRARRQHVRSDPADRCAPHHRAQSAARRPALKAQARWRVAGALGGPRDSCAVVDPAAGPTSPMVLPGRAGAGASVGPAGPDGGVPVHVPPRRSPADGQRPGRPSCLRAGHEAVRRRAPAELSASPAPRSGAWSSTELIGRT
jgi:hypothetical protein